jgi:hypothetical protein
MEFFKVNRQKAELSRKQLNYPKKKPEKLNYSETTFSQGRKS